MTILEMMTELEACGDLTVWERTTDEGTVYDVTVEDFEGFDEHWSEVMRDFEREDLVDEFLEALDEQALRVEGDFYYDYYFDGFRVHLGYASYDI
jgi:hypothetical protein